MLVTQSPITKLSRFVRVISLDVIAEVLSHSADDVVPLVYVASHFPSNDGGGGS